MGIFPIEIKVTVSNTDNDVLRIAAAAADLITRVKQISMTANQVNGGKCHLRHSNAQAPLLGGLSIPYRF